jgi:hypothetical protein
MTDFRNLPATLQPLVSKPHWVCWKWETTINKEGVAKRTKVPYRTNDTKALANTPSTWSTFDEVVSAYERGEFDGIGFCLLNSGIAAFDLDHCRDRETKEITPWVKTLVEDCNSYAEITPSQEGLRIIGFGSGDYINRKLRIPNANGAMCEPYRNCARYITISGNALKNVPLANIDNHINRVRSELGAVEEQLRASGSTRRSSYNDIYHIEPIEPDDPRLVNLDPELARVYFTGDGLAEKYAKHGGDKSRAVLGFTCECKGQNISDDVIASCLWYWKIGTHIHEQPDPHRAIFRAIDKASNAILEFQKTETRNGGVKIVARSQRNVRTALARLNIELSYDSFHDIMLVAGLPGHSTVDDAAVKKLWLRIDEQFHFMPDKEFFFTVVEETSRRNSFHPVRDYLNHLQWDGVARLDKWLVTYCGADDTDYVKAVGSIVLIAAVRRVRKPGCKFDEMMILESPQGVEKSTALAVLAVNDDWFSDDLPLNTKGKEAIEHIRGRWLIEAAEMSGMRKANVEHLKAFLSRQFDRGRMAYDRIVTNCPRQCVVIGTINSGVYLRDITGNRRFWPIKVTKFEIGNLKRDRDQLWAEAATREADGESIRLAKKLWEDAESEQKQRAVDDPWLEILRSALSDPDGEIAYGSISTETVWSLVGMSDKSRRTQDHNDRIGNIMKSILGFGRDRFRVDRVLDWYYFRGDKDQRDRLIEVRM